MSREKKKATVRAGIPPPSRMAWMEVVVFLMGILIMDLVYCMPQLINRHIPFSFFRELVIDSLFISLACVPGRWLHFEVFKDAGLKQRALLHICSGALYYGIWVLAYQVYNPFMKMPPMTGMQMARNFFPNILFYVQVFSFLHIYHYFRQREVHIQREKELQQLAHNGEVAGLKAQIQPHFLFNTLNSISASVPVQQEHTRELIARLADTFRYALMVTQEDHVPLAHELDFIKTYLSLEQHRFGARLQVLLHMDEKTAQVPIPPMLLQPLVENALKHGIEPSVTGGTITIGSTLEEKQVKITVSNTGVGYQGDVRDMFNTRGIGLRNTSSRLQKLYGVPLAANCFAGCLSFTFYIPVVET